MKLTLLYFGRPREKLGSGGETTETPDGISTVEELLAWLRTRGEPWSVELTAERVRCAVNQEMCDLSAPIGENDEIALFSPISGG